MQLEVGVELVQIDTNADQWPQTLETLYPRLGGAANETLLPYHFLQAAFPHIGGQVIEVVIDGHRAMVLFLMPHLAPAKSVLEQETGQTSPTHHFVSHTKPADDLTNQQPEGPQTAYIARCHQIPGTPVPDRLNLQVALAQLLGTNAVTLYDPAGIHAYTATTQPVAAIEIGRPSQEEATTIRELQQTIWGSTAEFLYPVDLHSTDFPLGTSLVARVDGAVTGFLFGFYKQGGPPLPGDWHQRWRGDLRLESQVMGVLPTYRGLRIGYLLKRIQAEQALTQGIGIIHWTVDPLQYPNAALNFGLLRAVAFTFTPDYYAFRNQLNRGPASRFSLTWLSGSARVQAKPLYDARSTILRLDQHPDVIRVNQGHQQLDFSETAPMLAVEIPANWTHLQEHDPDAAFAWRAATDQLFAHYVGSGPNKYVVTDVGVDGERRYLIMQRVTDYLWQRLEETQE